MKAPAFWAGFGVGIPIFEAVLGPESTGKDKKAPFDNRSTVAL